METNSPNIQDSFDDLFEHFSFIADVGQNPLRVDKFLMNRIENATRNKIQQAAKEGFIIVNNKPVKQNYKVKPTTKFSCSSRTWQLQWNFIKWACTSFRKSS